MGHGSDKAKKRQKDQPVSLHPLDPKEPWRTS
jgi:hypothetical protein